MTQTRIHKITVRFNAKEYDQLLTKSCIANVTLSDYIRQTILSCPTTNVRQPSSVKLWIDRVKYLILFFNKGQSKSRCTKEEITEIKTMWNDVKQNETNEGK